MIPQSKLPSVGTTIFSTMTALAEEKHAINLSQGFPDYDGPQYLRDRLYYHTNHGANQYAPMTGCLALREAIAEKINRLYGVTPDVDKEITVTAGGTEAIFDTVQALVRRGDEVILFDPSYDSYAPAVELAGGVVKRIQLTPPDFKVDWAKFATLVTDKTRLVILNTPHNPTATVFSKADFDALWQAIKDREIYVLSDEVYQHICFADGGHLSILQHPQLRERAIADFSFGKTYHATGWKVGYCIAPAAITAEIRKVHQYVTFAVNTPAQMALADMVKKDPTHYLNLPEFYRQKRDFLLEKLQGSKFKPLPCTGTFFLLLDYSAISDLKDTDFALWLIEKAGVVGIPVSVFCADDYPHKLIRLCFAKNEATLAAAAERLCQL